MATASTPSIARRLTLVAYFAVVLIPVCLFAYDGPWLGRGELSIRGRAPFPEAIKPNAFREFDEWFADRIGLRYPLIYVGTELHVGILRRPLDRHIFFGREGWMFWTDDADTVPASMADARGRLRFTRAEVAQIDRNLRAAGARFAQCGIPFIVVIIPNKETIYRKFLFGDDADAPVKRLDALLSQLSEAARALVVDPRAEMQAAAVARYPILLYPKTESHWNDLGAFYGYRAIMQALGRVMPINHPETLSLDRYQVSSRPYAGGDIAVRVLFSPWRFNDEYAFVRPPQPWSGIETSSDDHPIYRNPQSSGRLVLFADSFIDAMMPFLAQNFAEVHRIPIVRIDGAVAARLHPAAVVWEVVERHADRLLFEPVNLPALCE